jgi:predicted HicB family RNase H-like nuclease
MGSVIVSDDLEYKGFQGSIEYSAEDRLFFGKVLFIDSLLMYHGASVDEIDHAFKEAVDNYLAHCERAGKSPNKPYSGSFNVRVGTELHRKAAQAARKSGVPLNVYVTQAISAAVEQNGIAKVEHLHKHIVTVVTNQITETSMFATMKQPSSWESINATIQ